MKIYALKNKSGEFEFIQTNNPTKGMHLVPEQYTLEDIYFLTPQEVQDPEKEVLITLPNGEEILELVVPQKRLIFNFNSELKNERKQLKLKEKELSEAYTSMKSEVYDNLYEIFETRDPNTATANFETYKNMIAAPTMYSDKGLKVSSNINNADGTQLFDEGALLDTDQKVIDFATRKVELAHEYSAWRLQRIQQFNDLKAGK